MSLYRANIFPHLAALSLPFPGGECPHGNALQEELIEVALPLEDINRKAAREKSIRHVHPSTLHLWWARGLLAA